jgi:hypothetical protein
VVHQNHKVLATPLRQTDSVARTQHRNVNGSWSYGAPARSNELMPDGCGILAMTEDRQFIVYRENDGVGASIFCRGKQFMCLACRCVQICACSNDGPIPVECGRDCAAN